MKFQADRDAFNSRIKNVIRFVNTVLTRESAMMESKESASYQGSRSASGSYTNMSGVLATASGGLVMKRGSGGGMVFVKLEPEKPVVDKSKRSSRSAGNEESRRGSDSYREKRQEDSKRSHDDQEKQTDEDRRGNNTAVGSQDKKRSSKEHSGKVSRDSKESKEAVPSNTESISSKPEREKKSRPPKGKAAVAEVSTASTEMSLDKDFPTLNEAHNRPNAPTPELPAPVAIDMQSTEEDSSVVLGISELASYLGSKAVHDRDGDGDIAGDVHMGQGYDYDNAGSTLMDDEEDEDVVVFRPAFPRGGREASASAGPGSGLGLTTNNNSELQLNTLIASLNTNSTTVEPSFGSSLLAGTSGYTVNDSLLSNRFAQSSPDLRGLGPIYDNVENTLTESSWNVSNRLNSTGLFSGVFPSEGPPLSNYNAGPIFEHSQGTMAPFATQVVPPPGYASVGEMQPGPPGFMFGPPGFHSSPPPPGFNMGLSAPGFNASPPPPGFNAVPFGFMNSFFTNPSSNGNSLINSNEGQLNVESVLDNQNRNQTVNSGSDTVNASVQYLFDA